jgi:glycosyltransferase involved in cell wall biosynthesis
MAKAKRSVRNEKNLLVHALEERLKAVVVCVSSSWGGLEQIAQADAEDLADLDIAVRFLCIRDSPLHLNLRRTGKVKLELLDSPPRDFLDSTLRKKLKSLIKQEDINLIHCHQPSLLGSVIPWFLFDKKTVLVATRHIMNSHNKKDPVHKLLYHRLDSLFVMSEALKRNVIGTHAILPEKVEVVHYGIDFNRFDPDQVNTALLCKEWGADEKTIVIGIVGRIDPAKGQETFIKAAAGLSKTLGPKEKVKFVIVGEETKGGTQGEYLDSLKSMVSTFHLEQDVVFTGFKDDIPEVMASFDIFVMPSRQEAFGMVAIEAMAMHCPIIISQGGSSQEIIGQEEFGLLMRPEDAFDLQRQLRYLLDNPEERAQMGQSARDYVKKHYDRVDRLERTLELYERLLRARGH